VVLMVRSTKTSRRSDRHLRIQDRAGCNGAAPGYREAIKPPFAPVSALGSRAFVLSASHAANRRHQQRAGAAGPPASPLSCAPCSWSVRLICETARATGRLIDQQRDQRRSTQPVGSTASPSGAPAAAAADNVRGSTRLQERRNWAHCSARRAPRRVGPGDYLVGVLVGTTMESDG
jgi:hypothetical protein